MSFCLQQEGVMFIDFKLQERILGLSDERIGWEVLVKTTDKLLRLRIHLFNNLLIIGQSNHFGHLRTCLKIKGETRKRIKFLLFILLKTLLQ